MGRSGVRLVVKVNNLPQLDGAIRREVGKAVLATALRIEAGAKSAIQTEDKTGRLYPRSGGRTHQASAPGEAPATDTGTLVNSIATSSTGDLSAVVSVSADYGADLEFGTVRMEPRPFLGPAVEGERDAFVKAVSAAIGQAVQEVSTK